jgi:hypothetical protein
MRSHVKVRSALPALILALAVSAGATAQAGAQDTRVSSGSPPSPFSQNKQNEPAVAVDANHPNVLAAGSNDEIDMEACNAGPDDNCPFTPDVGTSGIYFSTNSAGSWHQPTYQGVTGRNCLGTVGDDDPECTPTGGPIGTVPNYDTVGLVSDGDPALAFGPSFKNGKAAWGNGSRLYYANLTYPLSTNTTFKGAEGIAVSYTDDVAAANSGANSAWSKPVVISKQNGGRFSDKEQIWADNASSSPFFGNVYVCYAAFNGNGKGFTAQPLKVVTSRDGGKSWTERQVTPAANNLNSKNGFGRSGCTVRTDSRGNVYVFVAQFGFDPTTAAAGKIQMIKSTDGGSTWQKPVNLFTAYDTCNYVEPTIGRCVEDGVGGARSDLSPAPSVDIANGAPSGSDATDRIVLTWVDGRDGLNHEHVMFTSSPRGGTAWTTPSNIERPGDRGYYSAPAISPNGRDVYLVYNAFTTPFRTMAVGPGNDRELVGVVLHADASSSSVGAFGQIHRGQPGDARGSSQNDLTAEFLGDYVYAAATRTYGAAVWNDMRNGADCPAVDSYRQALHDEAVQTGAQTAEGEEPRGESGGDADAGDTSGPQPPDVQQECPANFGNSDIYGGGFPDPTP